jgi:hypothetical protein
MPYIKKAALRHYSGQHIPINRKIDVMSLLSFSEALAESALHVEAPHLLLGNGFSIACRPNIFLYGKLYEQADFSKLSPYVKNVFEALNTQDFERIIKALHDAYRILRAYSNADSALLDTIKADADGLRELLVQTIANSHPAWPGEISDDEYKACRTFLAHFKTIYTFNYDLLLYWAQMHTEFGVEPFCDDGFRKPEDDFEATYVTWEPSQSHEQNTWFLHGALHVFDAGTEIQKYTWANTGIRLIDQIRDALSKNYFPLFVSEGTSDEKFERIRHSDYLAKAYRSFCEIKGSLFILGHSLAKNDEHYLSRIERGKLSRLYVGLHGDPLSEENIKIANRANQMSSARKNRPLTISYFDSSTAKVWSK